MHTQHFTVSITYSGESPTVVAPGPLSDVVFDAYCFSDQIDRLQDVTTIEEAARPSRNDLALIRSGLTPEPNDTQHMPAPDLAVISLVTEALDFAAGTTTFEELTNAITRTNRMVGRSKTNDNN